MKLYDGGNKWDFAETSHAKRSRYGFPVVEDDRYDPTWAAATENVEMTAKFAAEDEGGNTFTDKLSFTVRHFFDGTGKKRLSKVVKVGEWEVPNFLYLWQTSAENQDWLIEVAESGAIISWDDPDKEWQMHRICNHWDEINPE